MTDSHLSPWLWLAVAILPIVPLVSMLTVLLERSGPIRMRHWVEEAGGRLRRLYEDPLRFEVFRYLLNVVAKLLPLALFAALAATADAAGLTHALLAAGVVVAAVLAGTELASRSQVVRDPEEALRRLTWVYRIALFTLMPVVLAVLPIVPRRPDPAPESDDEPETASEEEVEAFIDVGTKEGILEPEDRDLVWGVVDFGDTQVRSVMTPRVDMIVAPVEASLDAIAEVFTASAYSRIPLYRGSIDQIVGVLHIRDLFDALRGPDPKPTAEKIATPPFLVPETKLLGELLKELQARRQQLAIVINEWGGTEGLVTLEDLLEEIVGEIADEHDEAAERENHLLDDGSLRIDGRAALSVLDEFFAYRAEDGPYETVGGMISGLLGRVPEAGEALEHDGLRFEIEKADERRILLVRVRRAEAEQVVS